MFKKSCLALLVLYLSSCNNAEKKEMDQSHSPELSQKRQAPAYPLITHDPYFSIWSFSDQINDTPTTHWTGTNQSLIGLAKVDGELYRFLGDEVPIYDDILPTAENQDYSAKISLEQPKDGWEKSDFDDTAWDTAQAPYGDGSDVKTSWKTDNLWYRRQFDANPSEFNELFLKLRHDDNVVVYLNGIEIYSCECWNNEYNYYPIPKEAVENLKESGNVLAIHVKNTAGGQQLDAGIVNRLEPTTSVKMAEQTGLDFTATQTKYTLECGDVELDLSFTSPLLLDDLELLSRPVSYVTIKARSTDGESHEVQLYFGASSAIASNVPSQLMITESGSTEQLDFLKAGTDEQPILEKKGDNLRIDWGYMYVAAPKTAEVKQYVSDYSLAKENFVKGSISSSAKSGKDLMLNTVFPQQTVSDQAVDHTILLAYDDIYSIQYFKENLRPWWNKDNTNSIEKQLDKAMLTYDQVIKRCEAFDKELYQMAEAAGGAEYAKLCEISYRQSIAAHKLVESPQGELLFLSKENFSNGCINTVDLTYPSAPLYLLYNPDLLKGMLSGIFYYSESGKHTEPFAAHDIGTYPIANGQVYGEPMPVEESGNMIISTAAITMAEDDASYAQKHWETLTTWAEYLAENGLDPKNQLCTDDFAGHLARNANLSIKAIVALRSYGYMAEKLGKKEVAEKYISMSEQMVEKWQDLADAGDHFALTFNDMNTWSQKYNLVWDKVMQFDIFPKSVYEKEISFYLNKQNKYGLPLDNRADYTKSDWIIWTATLSDNPATFKKLSDPVYKYAVETTSRVPLSDWYFTSSGEQRGFQARSVIGAHYMKILNDHWNPDN